MSYPPGYQYGQYAGYQGYPQTPQQTQQQHLQQQQQQQQQGYEYARQYQHPMLVIPSPQQQQQNQQQQQVRHDGLNSATPPLPSPSYPQHQHHPQSASQTGYYQQSAPPTQYYTAPQQQTQRYYHALSQQPLPSYPPQPQPQRQYTPQHHQQQQQQHHHLQSQSQPSYGLSAQRSARTSAPSPYQAPPRQQQHQHRPAPPVHPPSSPDPLQGAPNIARGHVATPSYTLPAQSQVPQPQYRSSQPLQRLSSNFHSQPQTHSQQSQQQRVVSAVEIPLSKSYSTQQPEAHDMARPAKRRRSNEGQAVPVSAPDVSIKQKFPQSKPVAAAPSPQAEYDDSYLPLTNIDYRTVLLGLADEYLDAAYNLSTGIASSDLPEAQHEYCALVSSAMACLESVLNNYRQLDARKEARIRLRLATIMIDECDNDEDAEAILGKGIALCESSRLPDLKYALQHVSIRNTFRTKQKAALKSIDKLVQEVEALKLEHWVYTFRFLRVTLGLQRGTHDEIAPSLKHLHALNNMAEERRHVAVQVVAATFEAIVHLRSHTDDAVDSALRAMATARTHQLGPEMKALPQVRGLLNCLDTACGLVGANREHASTSATRSEENLNTDSRNKAWRRDGSFSIDLGACGNQDLEQDTGGILKRKADGTAALMMQWLTHAQMWALHYTIGGFTLMWKAPFLAKSGVHDWLTKAMKMVDMLPDSGTRPLSIMSAQMEQQRVLGHTVRLFSIFSLCGQYLWEEAGQAVTALRKEMKLQKITLDDDTTRTLLYLDAVCRHGLGDLQGALDIYCASQLSFEPDSKASDAEKDIRALSTLNSIFILRSQGPSGFAKAEKLLVTIEPYCQSHKNKAIYAAVNIAKATEQSSVIRTKQYLHLSVNASKAAHNNLLLNVVMSEMTHRFFGAAIIGEQAEGSAKAARSLAKIGGNSLWICVADGLYETIKERCGHTQEADTARQEGLKYWESLPEGLKRKMAEADQRDDDATIQVARPPSPMVVVKREGS